MATDAGAAVDWEGRLLRWANAGLEAVVLYLVLSIWAQPGAGQASWLPALVCLALPIGMLIKAPLDSATVSPVLRSAANLTAAVAWAFVVVRVCAPPGYWQGESPRSLLVLGALFGGSPGSGLQPLGFWASLLLWWRGQALPSWEPGIEEALARLRLACLVGAVAVWLAGTGGQLLVQLVLLSTLLLLAITTTSLSRRREMAGGPLSPRVSPVGPGSRSGVGPVLLIVATAILVLGLAAAGANTLTPELLTPAIIFVMQLAVALGSLLSGLLAALGGLLPATPPPPPAEQSPTRDQSPGWSAPWIGDGPAWLGHLLALLLIGGAAGIAIFAVIALSRTLASALSSQIQVVGGSEREQTEPSPSAGPTAILGRLVELIKSLFREARAPERQWQRFGARQVQPEQAARESIRAAYRAYLAWAAEHGFNRRPAETPDELLRRLATEEPLAERDALILTDLYVATRYGGRTSTPGELRRAEDALSRLRTNEENLEVRSEK